MNLLSSDIDFGRSIVVYLMEYNDIRKFTCYIYIPRLSDKIKLQLLKAADAVKQPQATDSSLVTPALLETFSRVILWFGTKNFQCIYKFYI